MFQEKKTTKENKSNKAANYSKTPQTSMSEAFGYITTTGTDHTQ